MLKKKDAYLLREREMERERLRDTERDTERFLLRESRRERDFDFDFEWLRLRLALLDPRARGVRERDRGLRDLERLALLDPLLRRRKENMVN